MCSVNGAVPAPNPGLWRGHTGAAIDRSIVSTGRSIDGTCELIASAREYVVSGAVKGFGVAAAERTPLLPDVPASREGGMPELVVESWLGLYAPKGLPPEILEKLREAAAVALEHPLVQTRFPEIGGTIPNKEDRGGRRMLESVKRGVVRCGEVVRRPAVSMPSSSVRGREIVGRCAARSALVPTAPRCLASHGGRVTAALCRRLSARVRAMHPARSAPGPVASNRGTAVGPPTSENGRAHASLRNGEA